MHYNDIVNAYTLYQTNKSQKQHQELTPLGQFSRNGQTYGISVIGIFILSFAVFTFLQLLI